jgi:hypothetical protein
MDDYFVYLLRLSTGEVIRYAQASDCGNGYIHLVDPQVLYPEGLSECQFDRGMEVRKDQIVWVADDGYYPR